MIGTGSAVLKGATPQGRDGIDDSACLRIPGSLHIGLRHGRWTRVMTPLNTLDELLAAGQRRVIFSCVAGSRAYGTQVPGSDEDIRGLYAVPALAYLRLTGQP
jgi:hypothetical protein